VIWLVPITGFALLGFVSMRALAGRRGLAADGAPSAVGEGETSQRPSARPSRPEPVMRALPALTTPPAERGPGKEAAAPPTWQAFQDKFESESPDPKWAPKTTAEIRRTVAELALAGTTLVDARCAQTVCEVVFDHTSHEAQMQAPYSLTKGPFMTGVHYHYDGLRTTAYVQHE
jgi:hypothetical protein